MEKTKSMMIVITILLVVLLGIIVGSTIFIVNSLNGQKSAETDNPNAANPGIGSTANSDVFKDVAVKDIETVKLSESIVTNLLPEKEGDNYAIRISLSIGVDMTDKKESSKTIELLGTREEVIRDAVLNILRRKTLSDMSAEDSQERLAAEILLRLQEVFSTSLIVNVYVSDIYIP